MARNAPRRGFSLVEILIVLAILSLALLPIIRVYTTQRKQVAQAGNLLAAHTRLVELADQAVSRLRASRFSLTEETTGPNVRNVPWCKGTATVNEYVKLSQSKLTSGLWRVDATLDWVEKHGTGPRKHTLGVSRLVSDPSVGTSLPKEGTP